MNARAMIDIELPNTTNSPSDCLAPKDVHDIRLANLLGRTETKTFVSGTETLDWRNEIRKSLLESLSPSLSKRESQEYQGQVFWEWFHIGRMTSFECIAYAIGTDPDSIMQKNPLIRTFIQKSFRPTIGNAPRKPFLASVSQDTHRFLLSLQKGVENAIEKYLPLVNGGSANDILERFRNKTGEILENLQNLSEPQSLSEPNSKNLPSPRELREKLMEISIHLPQESAEITLLIDLLWTIGILAENLTMFSDYLSFHVEKSAQNGWGFIACVEEDSDYPLFISIQNAVSSLLFLHRSLPNLASKKPAHFETLISTQLGFPPLTHEEVLYLSKSSYNKLWPNIMPSQRPAFIRFVLENRSRFENGNGSALLIEYFENKPSSIETVGKILKTRVGSALSNAEIIECLDNCLSLSELGKMKNIEEARDVLKNRRKSRNEACQWDKAFVSVTKNIVTVNRPVSTDHSKIESSVEEVISQTRQKASSKPKIDERDLQVNRIEQLFQQCHFWKFQDGPQFGILRSEVIDRAFTCAKRTGAAKSFSHAFQEAVISALKSWDIRPLESYMEDFTYKAFLNTKMTHALDMALQRTLKVGSEEEKARAATRIHERIIILLRNMDPSVITSTTQKKNGRGTGSTANALLPLFETMLREENETDKDYLSRLLRFNWEHAKKSIIITFGRQQHAMDRLPTKEHGFYACMEALWKNIDDLKNRDCVDLSTIRGIIRDWMRDWEHHDSPRKYA